MNTSQRYIAMALVCWLSAISGEAQNSDRIGILPAINFHHKFNRGWSLNFKVESRQLFRERFDRERSSGYNYVLTDYTTIAARKIGLNARIAGGYLFRSEEGDVIHRFIQQYAMIQKLTGFRLAHRVVTDQTFSPVEPTELRLRYRLASEIPLSGQAADRNELYLKISNEYLNSLQDSDYDLEIRLIPLLGYILSDHHKIEGGLDYRVGSFLNGDTSHTFWTSLNWYIEI